MKEKVIRIGEKLWGWLGFAVLSMGCLLFVGLVLAMIIGGVEGEKIAIFLYKQLMPYVITFTSCIIVIGWFLMILKGEKMYTREK